jgi:diguanylate cyclase (GGDEF)-like protein
VCERLRTLCWSTAVPYNQQSIRWTVSIGLAEAGPHEDVHSLLQRADSALYRAKRDGRDRVSLSAAPEVQGKHASPRPSPRRTA